MINLLMLTLEFPPVNSTGCYRYLKFLHYLKQNGINPIVIAPTVKSSLQLWQNRKVDESLLKNIPSDIEIIRVPLPDKAYIVKTDIGLTEKIDFYLNYKDNASELWRPSVIEAIRNIVSNKKIDAFYVSPPPFSLCKLAADLSKLFSLPLILDMRDDWIINKGNPFPTYWHYRKIYKELKKALEQADKVIVVTPQLAEMSCRVYPELPLSKFSVITNGFDTDEFSLTPFKTVSLDQKDLIRIGYSGDFYFNPLTHANTRLKWWQRKGIRKLNYSSGISKEDWRYRSPLFFLKSLQRLIKKNPSLRSHVRFEHIGNTPAWLKTWVQEMGLSNNFHSHGFVSKDKNLAIQQELDAVLVTSEKVIDGEHYCISSKVFDAFLLHKPILGFVTDGICKEVLKKSGCSIMFDPDDIEESANRLMEFIGHPMSFVPDMQFLGQFAPVMLTEQLVREIYSIVGKEQLLYQFDNTISL